MTRSTRKGADIAALVLAAGNSRRMGRDVNKLCEEVGGKALVAWPVDAMCEAGVEKIRVVTGYQAEAVEAVLVGRGLEDQNCDSVFHANWESGMGGSIAAGLSSFADLSGIRGVFICMGDLAGLRGEEVGLLVEEFWTRNSPEAICVPTFGGRRGHPVLFGSAHFEALAKLSGDVGGKALIEAQAAHVREVEVSTSAIFEDLDTPEELALWRREHTAESER